MSKIDLSWLRKLFTDVLEIYFKYRGKAYVRIAALFISAGAATASTSIVVLAFQAFTGAVGVPDNSAPWWVVMLFGIGSMAVGLSVFVYYYTEDNLSTPAVSPKDHFNTSIPQGYTFKQAAELVGVHYGCVINLEEFDEAELNAILKEKKLKLPSAIHALQQLGALSISVPIRPYEVSEQADRSILVRRK